MYNIALIPGDGIGPEVIREGKRIIDFASELNNVQINWVDFPFGAEHYLKKGELLPDSVLEEIKGMDAIYLGAVGDPQVKPGILEKEILLKIRFSLDQYINLRPIRLLEGIENPLRNKTFKDINFYVVRENTEDFYIGTGASFVGRNYHSNHFVKRNLFQSNIQIDFHLDEEEEIGYQLGLLTRKGSDRIIRYAFELAVKKGLSKVSTVDKANVLSDMYGLWRRVFKDVSRDFPNISTDYFYVDAMTMLMVTNPERFQIVVTPNMFGDIITDLGAAIQGGIGIAASANINPEGVSMFEPIHGSAPDIKNQGKANPIAAILAGAMMMDHLGETEIALFIEKASQEVLREGTIKPIELDGKASTSEIGDEIIRKLKKIKN